MHDTPPAVVVVDDRNLRRAALVAFLTPWASSVGGALEAAGAIGDVAPSILSSARLVIVNVGGARLADAQVREELTAIRDAAADVGLAIISDSARIEDMVAGFQIGADGYVPTSTEPRIALQALGFVAAGGQFFPPTALVAASTSRGAERAEGGRSDALTARQREVLKLLREGKPNKVIARELDMQEATVKVHVRQIMRKLGVSNRTQAALACASEPSLYKDAHETNGEGDRDVAADRGPAGAGPGGDQALGPATDRRIKPVPVPAPVRLLPGAHPGRV